MGVLRTTTHAPIDSANNKKTYGAIKLLRVMLKQGQYVRVSSFIYK